MKGPLKAIFDNFRFLTQRFDQTIQDMQRKGALPEDYCDPALDTAKVVINTMLGEAPMEQMLGSYPLIMYFSTRQDAEELSLLVQQAKPGMHAFHAPRGTAVSKAASSATRVK